MPRLESRVAVQVVTRESTSISPDWSAVNRSLALKGMNSVAFASPRIAAATARPRSTSKPVHSPLLSGAEYPGTPAVTPTITFPRSLMISSVLFALSLDSISLSADGDPHATSTAPNTSASMVIGTYVRLWFWIM